jgi:hypothetical protein
MYECRAINEHGGSQIALSQPGGRPQRRQPTTQALTSRLDLGGFTGHVVSHFSVRQMLGSQRNRVWQGCAYSSRTLTHSPSPAVG